MFAKFPRKSLLAGTTMSPRRLGLFDLNTATKIVIFLDSLCNYAKFLQKGS